MAIISKVSYLGNLRTSATHLASKQEIISDAPVDNKGQGNAFSPTDLMSTALAQCGLTICGIAFQERNLELPEIHITVEKEMTSNPRSVGKITLNIQINGLLKLNEKKLLEHSFLNCPVALSLSEKLEKSFNFKYNV